ncbi:MAG: cytochrome c oxidase subunit II [Verrucomicrobiota bacterium]
MFDNIFDHIDGYLPNFLEMLIPRASTYAKHIDGLFDIITILVGFWFFLTLGYFFYLVFRYRARDGHKAEYVTGETHKQKLAVEVPHYLILVCDVVIIVFTFVVWHKVKIHVPEEIDEDVRVIAQQWAWTFEHAGADGLIETSEDNIIRVNELVVEEGKTYRYLLESKDVMHSFSVPVFRLKQDAVPGRVIQGWFEPNATGEWDIQCAEMCGVAHGIMGARIKIKNAEDFDAWLADNSPEGSKTEMLATLSTEDSQVKEDQNNG